MKSKSRKMLAIVVAVAMLIGMLPALAMAEDESDDSYIQEEEVVTETGEEVVTETEEEVVTETEEEIVTETEEEDLEDIPEEVQIRALVGRSPDESAGTLAALNAALGRAPITGEEYVIELTGDFFLTAGGSTTIISGKNIVLTSDGSRTLTVSASARHFLVEGILTLTDGVTLNSRYPASIGGGIEVRNGGTFNMEGGIITGNRGRGDTAGIEGGGGVLVRSGGTFYMYGGEISNNTSSSSHTSHGGGVNVQKDAMFAMTSGMIVDNYSSRQGGGVYSASPFTMIYSTISGNTSQLEGGGVFAESNFTMTDSEISGNKTSQSGGGVYSKTGIFTMDNSTIRNNEAYAAGGGVYCGQVFDMLGSSKITGNKAGKLYSGGGGGGVWVNAGATMTMSEAAVISGNEVEYEDGGGIFNWGGAVIMNGGTIGGDAQGEANTAIYGGGIYISNSGSLIMSQNAKIIGNTATQLGGGIYHNKGTLAINGGSISKNTAKRDGGGIYNKEGKLTIEGGVISGNIAERNGGGIFNQAGDLKIKGGVISGNSANGTASLQGGGGVFNNGASIGGVWSGTFEISDEALISSNKAANMGGGIYNWGGGLEIKGGIIGRNQAAFGGGVWSCDSFTVSGDSKITGNIATKNGGGVYLYLGDMTLKNGVISNNQAVMGGGVYLGYEYGASSLSMEDGAISGNAAEQDGGGVFSWRSTFTMKGGVIGEGNTAGRNGGGVYNAAGWVYLEGWAGVFNMSGNAKISGNTAAGNGGGVWNGAQFDISTDYHSYLNIFSMNDNAAISGNTAAFSGGGVLIRGHNTFSMNDGVIDKNTTAGYGGGVCIIDTSTFFMKGGAIDGNTAMIDGGGVLLWNWDYDRFIMEKGTISNNAAPNGDGGGIWTTNPENKEGVETLTIHAPSVFFGNTASRAFNRDLVDQAPLANIQWAGMGEPARGSSIYGTHLLNNYDVWFKTEPRIYVVSYDPNAPDGEWSGVLPATKSYQQGSAVTVSNVTLSREGYAFIGWSLNGQGQAVTQITGIQGDVTLYAIWQTINIMPGEMYTVRFEDWDGTLLKSEIVKHGGSATAPLNPTRSGYTFTGWNGVFTDVTEAITITAMYSVNSNGDNGDNGGTGQTTNPGQVTNPNSRPEQNEQLPLFDGEDYIEFGEDGTPLGEWHYDEDLGKWIFEEYPPLSDIPKTGYDEAASLDLFILFALSMFMMAGVAYMLIITKKLRRNA